MKKKIVIILFLLFLIIPASVKGDTEVIFESTIDSIGGIRYENFLVYYPYNSTGKTGTNVWGYEISVNEFNIVIEKNTNVTIVPGGYALSAHGTKKTQLMAVEIGDKVNLDLTNHSVKVLRDLVEGSYYLAKTHQSNAISAIDKAARLHIKMNELLVSDTKNELDAVMDRIETLYHTENITYEQENEIVRLSKNVKALSEKLIYYTADSNPLEIRAMWHRPNASTIEESSLDGVKHFLDRVEELGFNTLYVETFWNGYVSYRSEILNTHPKISEFSYGEYGNDYILALISEAKKRNIDIHAWIHTFNAGGITTISPAIKTEWLVEDYQKRTLHPNPYGGAYYLDPSNEEVLAFVDSMLAEMITKYDFAGVQLDYIRYYDNNYQSSPIRDSGYGEHAETAFKNEYHLSGDVRTMILNLQKRELWNEWRQNNISKAVKRFSELMRTYKKDLIISADVVGDINQAKDTYMQDWLNWVENGYIDLLCPMIYTSSTEHVDHLSNTISESLKNLTFLSSGIAPVYSGYPIMFQHEQMLCASKYGGSAIFASQSVIGNTDVEDSIKNGIYRNKAISLLSSADLLVDQTVDAIDEIINRVQDESICAMYEQKISQLSSLELKNPGNYQMALNQITQLILVSPYLQNEADETIFVEILERLYHAIDIKISRELIALGLYRPSEEERPDPLSFEYSDDPKDPKDPTDPTDPTDPDNPIEPDHPTDPNDFNKNNPLLWVGIGSGLSALVGVLFIVLKNIKRKVI